MALFFTRVSRFRYNVIIITSQHNTNNTNTLTMTTYSFFFQSSDLSTQRSENVFWCSLSELGQRLQGKFK